MRVTVEDDFFRGSHITGPTHNYLGLRIASDTGSGEFEVRALDPRPSEGRKLRSEEVRHWLVEGVRKANDELNANYAVAEAEFVVSDSYRPEVYVELARRIVLAAHARPRTELP